MPTKYSPRTLGIAGVVSALAGLFIGFGILLGPAALVLGWFSLRRGDGGPTRAWAIAALLLGALETLIAVLWVTSATWS